MGQVLIELQPVKAKVGKSVVRLVKDDLTAMEVDAFVFYAREDMGLDAGYGSAIGQRGGQSIKKELDEIGGIKMGEAVITGAGQMKAKHIIHACGPKFHEPETESKLRDCMLSALKVAGENKLKTVAFPPMGLGFYGVPADLCSTVMLDVIKSFLQGETSLEEVIICVIDMRDFEPFKDKVARL